MEIFSVREVVEQAVQTEKLGYEFYTAIAKRFEKDEKLKELFETLALKEQIHEKTFSELREGTGDEQPENWEEASAYLRAIIESEFFLGKGKSLPLLENIKTISDAIHNAIGFEKETLLYFHALRDIVSEKEVVDRIIKEEKSHIVWLDEFKKLQNQNSK